MQRRFPPITTTASQSPTPAKEVTRADVLSAIDKVNGKLLYSWEEKAGVWKKV